MGKCIRIGTRDSQLALWQANEVKGLLEAQGYDTVLVFIRSDGDIDLVTPLYELGVQGVFTKALDAALLSNRIDIAVHSMKDVPTGLAQGIAQACVLPRASYRDILVYKDGWKEVSGRLGYRDHQWSESPAGSEFTIATSSIRRRAQWLHRYPGHRVQNLRGNVNTRLQKLKDNDWDGAVFAAAGLERINLRPEKAIELDWMLPAPAQGAVMVVARDEDRFCLDACSSFNDTATAMCAGIERDFLRTLLGGCSTPVSALAVITDGYISFEGSVLTPDGTQKASISKMVPVTDAVALGITAAHELLNNGGGEIVDQLRNAGS